MRCAKLQSRGEEHWIQLKTCKLLVAKFSVAEGKTAMRESQIFNTSSHALPALEHKGPNKSFRNEASEITTPFSFL